MASKGGAAACAHSLGLGPTEERLTLAGNVTVAVKGGDLTLTGVREVVDGQPVALDVRVEENQGGGFTIRSEAGTTPAYNDTIEEGQHTALDEVELGETNFAGGKTERVVTVRPFPEPPMPPEAGDFGSPDFYAAIAAASLARRR